jgi:hypothetical protein
MNGSGSLEKSLFAPSSLILFLPSPVFLYNSLYLPSCLFNIALSLPSCLSSTSKYEVKKKKKQTNKKTLFANKEKHTSYEPVSALHTASTIPEGAVTCT